MQLSRPRPRPGPSMPRQVPRTSQGYKIPRPGLEDYIAGYEHGKERRRDRRTGITHKRPPKGRSLITTEHSGSANLRQRPKRQVHLTPWTSTKSDHPFAVVYSEIYSRRNTTRSSAVAETARCVLVIEDFTKSLKVIGNDILEKGVSPY